MGNTFRNNCKGGRVAIIIFIKIDFKIRNITREKQKDFTIEKMVNASGDVSIKCVYTSNISQNP